MFIPLRIITGYSFLSSGLTIPKVLKNIEKNKYPGAGICDQGVLYGLPEYCHMCQEAGKKSLIGMELTIESQTCCLYITSEEAYRELCKITAMLGDKELTLKDLEGQTKNILLVINTHTENFKALFDDDYEMRKTLLAFSRTFLDVYLGVSVTTNEDKEYAERIRHFASQYPYPLVAFPTIKYEKPEDAIVLAIVDAIKNERTIEEKEAKGEECFHSEAYYSARYTPEEIANTEEILNSSTFDYFLKRGRMIHYTGGDTKNLLKETAFAGLKAKNLEKGEYFDRLNRELTVIDEMGYNDYFLVVADYVKYAREHGILTGPGRGSAGGSLVAYATDITEIDPIKDNLQFERFLNQARQSMPDIDVDFMDVKRDEVVEYVRQKYGQNRVANIITFSTILAKQALRDIGRVYQYKDTHIDSLCKMLGNHSSLREAYRIVKLFREQVDSDKYILEIVTLASKIEGLPRQSGLHAAGVILNDEPLENAMPINKDFSGNYITQYEMEYLEEDGFLKMDFLGLRNLTTIQSCVDLVNRDYGLHLDPYHLDWDQPKAYELISKGDTMGIFQLESAGMKRAIRQIEPSCFDDIVAILALFRPGPMQSLGDYAARKKGKEQVTYLSPEMEKILAPTYGIIVYQEQINEIATTMANLSRDEADIFRRAVSKKDASKMAALEKEFIDGAVTNGYTLEQAKSTFDLISKFADYGFNKSHAVGYATITMEMAYLKAYYPLEFYACLLDTTSRTDSKFNEYLLEMRDNHVSLGLPSINYSTTHYVIKDGKLLYPLNGIKGLNQPNVLDILKERDLNGPFEDFYSFVTRMFPYRFTENMVNKLIDAGAFDELNPSRASLRASILYAFQTAKLSVGENGQLNLGIALPKPKIITDKDIPRVNLEKEYEVLGTTLSRSPLLDRSDLLKKNNVTPLNQVTRRNYTYKVAGLVVVIKKIKTKKKQDMAYIKIYDDSGELEITIFPSLYEKVYNLLANYNCLLVSGRLDAESFIADEISLLE